MTMMHSVIRATSALAILSAVCSPAHAAVQHFNFDTSFSNFFAAVGTLPSTVTGAPVVLDGTLDIDPTRSYSFQSAGLTITSSTFPVSNATFVYTPGGSFDVNIGPATPVSAAAPQYEVSFFNNNYPGTNLTASGASYLDANNLAESVTGTGSLTRVAAVPEPATWAMMLGGFYVIGDVLRRRKIATSLKFT